MKVRIPQGPSQKEMMAMYQKVQEDLAATEEEYKEKEFKVEACGGKITVTATTKEIRGIKIAPELIDPEDPEMLEDMIAAAVNEALSKANEEYNNAMEAITGGLKLPGGLR